MGPPVEIAPNEDPVFWTDRQIARMLKELPNEEQRWQAQMQNKGVHYESLQEMQQKEVARKREKSEQLRLQEALMGPRSSSPDMSWIRTRGQPVIPLEKVEFVPDPNSMLGMYEEESLLKKQRLTHAKTIASVMTEQAARMYTMPTHQLDEMQHDSNMRMSMPAIHRESQLGLANQRRAMSVYGDACASHIVQRRASVIGLRSDEWSASRAQTYAGESREVRGSMSVDNNASMLHPDHRRGMSSRAGARTSLGIGMHASKSQEVLGLSRYPRAMEGVPHPLRRVVSMTPAVATTLLPSRINSGHTLHRSGIGQKAQSHQIGSEQVRDPIPPHRHHVQKSPASLRSLRVDRAKGLYDRTHPSPNQLQYTHRSYHDEDFSVRTHYPISSTPETPPQHLVRPSTAPLERRRNSSGHRVTFLEQTTGQRPVSSTNLSRNKFSRQF
jgi:hypothetical protein